MSHRQPSAPGTSGSRTTGSRTTGSGTAFEHALLAKAFQLLLADGQPVSPAPLAVALGTDRERVERTLARLDQQGRLRRDPSGAVTGCQGLSVTPTPTSIPTSIPTRHEPALNLEHLFDAELAYRDGAGPAVAAAGREGVLIGSGDGTVTGPGLRGTIHWSMYTAACPYRPDGSPGEGQATADGDHFCRVNPGGLIRTEDGGEVWFDANGFGFRRRGPSRSGA